jgi:predicted O-linked N-acetylglucosamine transferase (SPINDLY family)
MNTREVSNSTDWYNQGYQYLLQGNYDKAIQFYEQAITEEPSIKSNYWHLGLAFLLQGQETEAQMTWLLAMEEGTDDQIELWTVELVQILQTEAERREALENYPVAWAIRQHIREISPDDINNLLKIVQLSIQLETFTGEDLIVLGVMPCLQSEQNIDIDTELLLNVLKNILDYALLDPLSLDFAEACLPYIQEPLAGLVVLLPTALKMAYSIRNTLGAICLAEFCLRLEPQNPEVLRHLAAFYQDVGEYTKGIETAKFCYSLLDSLPDQVFANHLIHRGILGAGGYWQDAFSVFQQQESLLLSLIKESPSSLSQIQTIRLFCSTFFFPYLRDEPKKNRFLQNQVAELCQANIQIYAQEPAKRYSQRVLIRPSHAKTTKPLRIGYLSHALRRNSVGWLARWLFQYHNREHFQLYAYFISYRQTHDPLQEWYVEQVSKANKLGMDGQEAAEQIYQDDIDILIDLDSITLNSSCEVMALKPAPIQATWLGWDASGLPAIDYFIADPYVLPESAQDYYTEKIWRLPHTYIAVDGFEIGVPDLRRDQLDIPHDAIIYLSAQTGYKRHLDTVRLQMQILKEVPNSYFLIKGLLDDDEAVQRFFIQIAEEQGVNYERLRFLPDVALESTHRANLGIADVVLDTYPYNGATTTLETLWMCIPLVTRVGQQFAARNSYTMMMNAGVTEGIAWTDEEYIEWGIRLGKDETLRQQVAWKLKQSRQTSPLWNAKQFTREMEKAYEQMWQRYIEANQ